MRQFLVLLFVLSVGGVTRLNAQASLKGTAWKFYVEALHDTLTMHIGADTSFSTTSSGEMVVRSSIKMDKDTLKITDVDGEYPCNAGEGVYRVSVDGDLLSFLLIADPCPYRSEALAGQKFRKAAGK